MTPSFILILARNNDEARQTARVNYLPDNHWEFFHHPSQLLIYFKPYVWKVEGYSEYKNAREIEYALKYHDHIMEEAPNQDSVIRFSTLIDKRVNPTQYL